MMRRPQAGDTEEDLLKLQQEFFASKKESDSKKSLPSDGGGPERDVIKLSGRASSENEAIQNLLNESDETYRFKIPSYSDLGNPSGDNITLMAKIQEQEFSSSNIPSEKPCMRFHSGFPSAPSLSAEEQNSEIKENKNKPKESIFARKFMKSSVDNFGGISSTGTPYTVKYAAESTQVNAVPQIKEKLPNIICGSGLNLTECATTNELTKIHEENTKTMQTMTPDKIQEEQQNLLAALDPKLISFIKSKRKATPQSTTTNQSDENKTRRTTEQKEEILNPNRSVESMDTCCSTSSTSNTDEFTHLPTSTLVEQVKPSSSIGKVLDDEQVKPSSSIGKVLEQVKPSPSIGKVLDDLHVSKGMLNMSEVELEKMEWMADVPPPQGSSSQDADLPRFDFDGNLIPRGAEGAMLTYDRSLYHHGDDPGSAGYTLQELFHIARSNVRQQRVLSLKALGEIVRQHHLHNYAGKLTVNLLEHLLTAGLPFLLRWALDDHDEQVASVTLAAFANLLYIDMDQESADRMLYSSCGFSLPKLSPSSAVKNVPDSNTPDAELLQIDVVQGLVQMQILPRLAYIMAQEWLSAVAFANALEVLIRIAQHDEEMASQVMQCTHVLDVVFNGLMDMKHSAESDLLKVLSFKLIRCLCVASQKDALQLYSSHGLKDVLAMHISDGATIQNTDDAIVFKSCLHAWNVLLHYSISTQLVVEMHTMLTQRMHKLVTMFPSVDDELSASLIMLIGGMIRAIATMKKVKKKKKKEVRFQVNDEAEEEEEVEEIPWCVVESYQPMVLNILASVKEFVLAGQKINLPLTVAACLRVLSCYHKQLKKQNVLSSEDHCQCVQTFLFDYLQPMDILFNILWKDTSLYSDMRKSTKCEQERSSVDNLPTYGTHIVSEEGPRSINRNSPIIIVQSLLQLVLQLLRVDPSIATYASGIIAKDGVIDYIRLVLEERNLQKRAECLATCRIEVDILCQLVDLFKASGKISQSLVSLYQELIFCLLPVVNDNARLLNWFQQLVFNASFYRTPTFSLMLRPGGVELKDFEQQLQSTQNHLPEIKDVFCLSLFGPKQTTDSSLHRNFFCERNSAIPSDWMYLPIVGLYNTAINIEMSGSIIASVAEGTIATLKYTLEYIFLLETVRPALLSNVNETIRLIRILCVFLIEGQTFLEEPIQQLLHLLITLYSQVQYQSEFDFEMDLPGILSFYDFYLSLLEHYCSCSFGDSVFANALLLPLQTRHSVKYRIAFWNEQIVRIFPLQIKQVSLDISSLLLKEEQDQDEELIQIYLEMMGTNKLRHSTCPVLYLLAVQHINCHIFNMDSSVIQQHAHSVKTKSRIQRLNQVIQFENRELRDDIVMYQRPNLENAKGFDVFQQLPPRKQLIMQSRLT